MRISDWSSDVCSSDLGGVLFVTIEDETGIANGILWPDRFEIYRRQIMSASMIGMRGRLQKEGEVIHIICDRIVDHDDALRAIGRVEIAVAPSRADQMGRASGRDRVCQYVYISVGAGSLKRKRMSVLLHTGGRR